MRKASPSLIASLAGGTGTFRVYTFQHRDAYAAALERGYFTGSDEHAVDDPDDPWNWGEQYDWMREQMRLRIPGFSGEYPMWAYLTRPNLRQSTHQSDSVLVVADIPRERMLVSDHSNWHMPLNRWYVCATEAEDDAHDLNEGRVNYVDRKPRVITDAMRASWERIFELGAPSDPAVRAWLGSRDDLQACVDRIHLHEIVRVTERPGRLGKRNPG